MCGRIAQSEPSRYAQRLRALLDPELDWQPSWNIGPTAPVLGVRARHGERVLSELRWGLVPWWSDDPRSGARAFNARVESVATKPTFRQAFERRRLLVPVDGFYEWASVPGSRRKQPYFFRRADGDVLVLAGLWEYWARGDDRRLTATVLTSPAGADMTIHDRQPVVLEPEEWERWLNPAADAESLLDSRRAPRGGVLVAHPVATEVSSVRNDGPHLVAPVAPVEAGASELP